MRRFPAVTWNEDGRDSGRLRKPRDRRYQWAWLFGAVWPARDIGAALVLPGVSSEAMNLHLAELSTQVAAGAHGIVMCDGAGCHQQGDRLRVPASLTLLPLPPYAPELNPVENIWQYLRGNRLSLTVRGQLRADRRCLPPRLELPHPPARAHRLHRLTSLGIGQSLGPSV